MQHLRDRAHAEMGGVDLLANNAGVAAGGPFDEIPLDDWRWVVDVNLFGVILGCRTFVPEFKRQGHGYILNVGSVAGLLSVPNLAPYSVTKYGVVALSEALYAELRDFGVHVTVLCPSFFRTGIIERSRGTDESTREVAARLMERSKIQAPEVAARALTALERGQLYALPMEHGKWVWRAKRAAPVLFYRALARSRRRLEQYFGRP
jgi:short-subunit dehydrogenase